jgi:hypothetical protein
VPEHQIAPCAGWPDLGSPLAAVSEQDRSHGRSVAPDALLLAIEPENPRQRPRTEKGIRIKAILKLVCKRSKIECENRCGAPASTTQKRRSKSVSDSLLSKIGERRRSVVDTRDGKTAVSTT